MFDAGRVRCVAIVLVFLFVGGVAVAQKGALSGVVIETMDAADSGPSLRVQVGERGDPAVSEVRLDVGRRSARDTDTSLIPSGWRSELDGGTIVCSGPSVPPPVYIGLDPGIDVATPDDIGVQVFSDGDRVFKDRVPVVPHNPSPVGPDDLADVISLPPSVSPGETITTTVVDPGRAPRAGQWTLDGQDGQANEPPVSGGGEYTVTFPVPDDLQPGTPIDVVYVDPWGAPTIDVDAGPNVNVTQPAGELEAPRIDSSQRYAFVGLTGCVCGHFPTVESRAALEVGGMPVGEPVAASSSSIVFRLPEGIIPGEHAITARPDAGFEPQIDVEIVALQLSGSIDQDLLMRGQSTPMQIWIEGTEEPLELLLVNRTPEIVSLEGGEEGVVVTSGGAENTVDRIVHGRTPGDFRIIYEMANDPCPCGPGAGDIVTQPDENPLVQTGYPVPPGVTVGTPVSTGRTTGTIAEVEVRNDGTETIFFPDRPVLIPSSEGNQGYVVPRGRSRGTPVLPGGSETVPLDGYCTDVSKPPVPSGESLPGPSEWSVPSDPSRPFPEPGSSDFFDEDPEVLVIGGVEEIIRVTEELQESGELETPFSSNPGRERETVSQQTIWIYTSELDGEPYTRDDFAERLEDQYEERTGTPIGEAPEEDQERLEEGIDEFWDAFELVGERAKVLAPAEEISDPTEPVSESPEKPPCEIRRTVEHSQADSEFKMSESYKDAAKRANLQEWFAELPEVGDAPEGGTFQASQYPASAWALAGRDLVGGYCNAVAKHIFSEAGGGTDWVWSTEKLDVDSKSRGTHTLTVIPPAGEECETLVVGAAGGVVEAWSNAIDPIANSRGLIEALRMVRDVTIIVVSAAAAIPTFGASVAVGLATWGASKAFDAEFTSNADAGAAVEGQMVLAVGDREWTLAAHSRSEVSGAGKVTSDGQKTAVGQFSNTHPTTMSVNVYGLAALKTSADDNGVAEGTLESQIGVAMVGFCRCGGGVQVEFLNDSGVFLVDRAAQGVAVRAARRLEEMLNEQIDPYMQMPPNEVIPKARQDLPRALETMLRTWYLENGSDPGKGGHFGASSSGSGGR